MDKKKQELLKEQDELELLLLKMNQSDSEMLSERIAKINSELQDTSDGIPVASASVDIDFTENGYNVTYYLANLIFSYMFFIKNL